MQLDLLQFSLIFNFKASLKRTERSSYGLAEYERNNRKQRLDHDDEDNNLDEDTAMSGENPEDVLSDDSSNDDIIPANTQSKDFSGAKSSNTQKSNKARVVLKSSG